MLSNNTAEYLGDRSSSTEPPSPAPTRGRNCQALVTSPGLGLSTSSVFMSDDSLFGKRNFWHYENPAMNDFHFGKSQMSNGPKLWSSQISLSNIDANISNDVFLNYNIHPTAYSATLGRRANKISTNDNKYKKSIRNVGYTAPCLTPYDHESHGQGNINEAFIEALKDLSNNNTSINASLSRNKYRKSISGSSSRNEANLCPYPSSTQGTNANGRRQQSILFNDDMNNRLTNKHEKTYRSWQVNALIDTFIPAPVIHKQRESQV